MAMFVLAFRYHFAPRTRRSTSPQSLSGLQDFVKGSRYVYGLLLQLLVSGKQRVDQWHTVGEGGTLPKGSEGSAVGAGQGLRDGAIGIEDRGAHRQRVDITDVLAQVRQDAQPAGVQITPV